MSSTQDKIKVMQAFVDGKNIEVDLGKGWEHVVADEPWWDWKERDYRIKPEPKTIWVNEYDDCNHVHRTEKDAHVNAEANRRYGKLVLIREAVKYREVIE